ncbi:hypothetical protein HQQ94_05415 [Shewanella sp. VB17]|uniref:hypothetical protein n=1 Tax=Shewanella sp. VB17 TaxID=2739432 RepID=UPI0015670305|nr:hypothetical protein [Shewanella sp. VB17]NRD72695.1 hypothetical protein [Shewanella sp. VB17]
MSTQETGALIESVNNMTATVTGKMGEIDKKVNHATESVPNAIRSMASVNFFVSNDGHDLTGNGSFNKPFKTILFAIKQAIPGSFVTINLFGNQEYICESNVHHNSSHGKNILITVYHANSEVVIKPKITFRMTKNPKGTWDDAYVCNYFEGEDFSLTIRDVDIIHESIPTGGKPYYNHTFGGVVTRGTVNSGGLNVTLRFVNCGLATGDHPFVTGLMGYLNVHLRVVSISKGGTMDSLFPKVNNNMAMIIGLQSVSISGFTSNLPDNVFSYDPTKAANVLSCGL